MNTLIKDFADSLSYTQYLIVVCFLLLLNIYMFVGMIQSIKKYFKLRDVLIDTNNAIKFKQTYEYLEGQTSTQIVQFLPKPVIVKSIPKVIVKSSRSFEL
jgi:hypothetical protein